MEDENNKQKKLLKWSFPEYVKHERSVSWFVFAAIFIFICLIFSIKTNNFLFPIIIIMIALIILNSHKKEPLKMNFSILERGIKLNKKFYNYNDINNFWIVYDPPGTKNLYFEINNVLKTVLIIPFSGDISPLNLRDILLKYLEEDLEREGFLASEEFGRLMKL